VRGARAGSSVGSSGTSSGYVGVGGQTGRTTPARGGVSGTGRAGSGIGRGLRARGRGLG
jgi:hypothetical protein